MESLHARFANSISERCMERMDTASLNAII
jgi:hypothetical protein